MVRWLMISLLAAGAACGGKGAHGTLGQRDARAPADTPDGETPSTTGKNGDSSATPKPDPAKLDTLRKLAAAVGREFFVGTAITEKNFPVTLDSAEDRALMSREFNRFSAGNELKMTVLQPSRGTFNFTKADRMIEFAQQNGMAMYGHVLVYDVATPEWVKSLPAAEVGAVMDAHVETVVKRFKGKVDVWEVVNETINNNPATTGSPHKASVYFNALGEEFIDRAFLKARAHDANARLIINENITLEKSEVKVEKYYQLVQRLLARKVPIDGVGFQCHLLLGDSFDWERYRRWFQKFADLGLELYITELDVTIRGVSVANPPSAAQLAEQGKVYSEMVRVALEQPAVRSVVFWGYRDDTMWRAPDGFALLFDSQLRPKPAFTSILREWQAFLSR